MTLSVRALAQPLLAAAEFGDGHVQKDARTARPAPAGFVGGQTPNGCSAPRGRAAGRRPRGLAAAKLQTDVRPSRAEHPP